MTKSKHSQTPSQRDCPSPPAPSRRDFLTSFANYIRIDISSASADPNAPHELLQFLQAAIISVLNETVRITSKTPIQRNTTAVFWPSLFVFSSSEAEQSASVRQHRGCFLVGLKFETEEEQNVTVFETFKTSFEQSVQSHRIWVDEPVEPGLHVRFVKQEHLGRLVADEIMWPHPSARALVIGREGFEASTSFHAPTEAQLPTLTPQGKLRPASDVLHRLRWVPDLNAKNYAMVYLDRFTGYHELPISAWKSDISDDEFIPLHRIISFRHLETGEIVWSREFRIDKIFQH